MSRAARLIGAGLLAMDVVGSGAIAAQPSSDRARQSHDRAVQLERQGHHAAALALLWEAANLDPGDADVQNGLGEALERIGALDVAVDAFQRALRERPSFDKAANNLILALVKAGRGPEATEKAEALVRVSPGRASPLFTLGLAQSEQDVDAAIATFRSVLALDPKHVLARYNLALALRRTDRLADALAELDRLVAIERRPEAFYTIGVIRWHQGELDPAVAALRTAIELQPRYAEAYDALGAIYKQRRDYAAAGTALRRGIDLRPDLPAPRYSLGLVLQLEGRTKEAESQFADAERLRRRAAIDHEALTWTSVGIGAVGRGDLQRGLECFERATATSESYAPAHYQMGLVLHRLGRPEAARAAFARAHALNPNLVPPRLDH